MKKIAFVSAFFILLTFNACQSSIETKSNILETIASDELYIQLEKTAYENMSLIANNAFDLKAVLSVNENHRIQDICNIDKTLFTDIKGAELYLDISCRDQKLVQQLDEKYNYLSLSVEDMDQIHEIYNKNTGGVDKENLIQELFSNLPKK